MSELAVRDAATAPADPDLQSHISQRVADSFRDEELAGLRLSTRAILFGSGAIMVWLFVFLPLHDALYYGTFTTAFCGLHVVHYRLRRSRVVRAWVSYVALVLLFALVSTMFIAERFFFDEPWPPQDLVRTGIVVFYFVFLAPVALTYSPRLMLWAGLACALGWAAIIIFVLRQPDTIPRHPVGMTSDQHLALHRNPGFVDINMRVGEILSIFIVAGTLAAVVWRSRRLVIRQASAARERANLARYFPPTIVDQLAELDEPLKAVRAQPVAVMFADIVGFTQLAERAPPDRVFDMLREFHALMERAVFDHEGTLDKFLGDGLMATFGTPSAGPRDAINAIACAQTMLAAIHTWNEQRTARGLTPIRLSIGIHYGNVILGDVGSERRLEFAVLGDVVNVASRLEELTRELACRAVVSDAVVRVARREAGAEAGTLLANFQEGASRTLRGREEPVTVWTV